MNYEQKHDEFFTRLQRLIETSEKKGHIIVRIEDLKSTFPELAESEDEKHRNWILEYLYDGLRKADEQFKPQFEAAIAWLEKQSESKTDCPQNHQDVNHPNGCIVKADFNGGEGFYKVNLDYLNKKQVEEIEEMIRVWNKEISNNGNIKHCVSMCLTDADEQRFKDYGTNLKDCLAWLEKQQPFDKDKVAKEFLRSVAISIMNWLDGNIPEDKMCLSNMECEDIENAVRNADWNKIYAYMKKKLEKQGEQKDSVVDFKAKDWYVSKVDGKIHNIYHSVDKAEPKFKVGDWVVRGKTIMQISDIQGQYYIGIDIYGNDLTSRSDKIHLWTIQDAKDGDVLVDEDNNIGLYSGEKDDLYWHSCIYLGCDGYIRGGFRIGGYHKYNNAHPAAKEQRDLLFQKMKEAGYEWDAEKKELKRIGQKPGDKVEPKFHKGAWVVSEATGSVYQIEDCIGNLSNHKYGYDLTDGGYIGSDEVNNYHLWTIQDAKDGDVLATSAGAFIYNGSKNEVTIGAYCGFNAKHMFSPAYNYVINQNITHATQEQRDTLMKAMADAGYTFDFEKKELRKIEHKMLDADKVIEWIDEHVPTKFEDMENYVKDFKQDFGLC